LTAGVDKVLREKQDKLAEIKVDSYYQRKKTQAGPALPGTYRFTCPSGENSMRFSASDYFS
jgi:hypothetical protein